MKDKTPPDKKAAFCEMWDLSMKEQMNMEKQNENLMENKSFPAVALRGLTILPDMIIHFDLSRKKSISAVEKAMMGDQRLFLVAQKDPNEKEPDMSSVYHVGTVAAVKQITKLPNGIVRVLVEGEFRAELVSFVEEEEDFLLAEVKQLFSESDLTQTEEEAMLR